MFKTTAHHDEMTQAAIEEVNFAIGCMTNAQDPLNQVVAILLDPESEGARRKAVVLDGWEEVLEVVSSILQAATSQWGPPPVDEQMVALELGPFGKGH